MARNQRSSYLPQELVTTVLVRLLVKSLGRFKCVCKEWFTLIGDPQFAESHLQLSLHARGIIYQQANQRKVSYVDFDVERGVEVNFDFNLEQIVRDSVTLQDSCNGHLLLESSCSERQYYVCNPITQRYSKLPRFFYNHGVYNRLASLSYDNLSQKYKVFIIFRDATDRKNMGRLSNKCVAFTVLGNKWRKLDFPVKRGFIVSRINSIDGAMYWLVLRTAPVRVCIVQMDLTSEKFSLIDSPLLQSSSTISWPYSLHKMKDSLCLAVSVSSSGQLELWVLNDAVKQAWSKEFSINFQSIIDKFDLDELRGCRQLFITEHPRPVIIFFDIQRKCFVLYDLVTRQFKVENKDIGMRKNCFKLAHVNSFVSF